MLVRLSLRVGATERNRRRGSRLVRNGATSLRAGCGKQHSQHRQKEESGAKSTAQKRLEDFGHSSIHCRSLRFLGMKEDAERGIFACRSHRGGLCVASQRKASPLAGTFLFPANVRPCNQLARLI